MTLAASEPLEPAQNRARKSSFYLAMRLMPPSQRQAMFEIYSFCRAVDDIADDGLLPPEIALSRLDRWRADLAALGELVARLSADDRIAWLLRYVSGCSLDEVAEQCRCSLATAKRRVALADEAIGNVGAGASREVSHGER